MRSGRARGTYLGAGLASGVNVREPAFATVLAVLDALGGDDGGDGPASGGRKGVGGGEVRRRRRNRKWRELQKEEQEAAKGDYARAPVGVAGGVHGLDGGGAADIARA